MAVSLRPAERDFSAATRRALARRGIRLLSTTVIPAAGTLGFARGDRGYFVDDRGCGRVWTHRQVLEAAAQ